MEPPRPPPLPPPEKGPPAFELFLIKIKEDIFSIFPGHPKKFNLKMEKYLKMRSLQNDKSVLFKQTHKGSALVSWERHDYLKETQRELSDSSIFKEVKITEKYIVDLVDKSNKIFVKLRKKSIIH